MKKLELLRAGLQPAEVQRRAARVMPDFIRGSLNALTVLQAHLMSEVDAVNNRSDDFPVGLLGADLIKVHESAAELQSAIWGVSGLGVAVMSHCSAYTHHDRLQAEYGAGCLIDGIDVFHFGQDDVTGIVVQPRRHHDDTFDPQINLRVRSDQDPLLSVRGEDGGFHDAVSPGRWYKFPLDVVLVAGNGFRTAGQQM
jgi:hypothetical protein